MINKILLTLIFIFTINVSADELLPSCSDIKNKTTYEILHRLFKNYLKLNQYLEENNITAEYCQQLNNHEYLYTTSENFFYCDFNQQNTSICSEEPNYGWFSTLEMKQRIQNINGKQFILLKTSNISKGIYSSQYHIFYLTPKKYANKGFKIQTLHEAITHHGSYSFEGAPCSNLSLNEKATELSGDYEYEIFNQELKNIGIRFTQKITSCKTNKSKIRTLEYMWTGKTFELSK